MKRIDETLSWFRDKENLQNLRTITTFIFVFTFVIYFYGFRSGFDLALVNIEDVIIDMGIFILSSMLIINDFAMRGIRAQLDEENPELKELVQVHINLTRNIDEDKIHHELVTYNKNEEKKLIEKKKRDIAKRIRRKRRKYLEGSRRFVKLTEKITIYEHLDTTLKVRYTPVTVDDLIKRGINKDRDKDISVSYSPLKDTVRSQSGIVLSTVLFTSIIRFALNPTWENAIQGFIFLSILIPFLIIRAVTSYQVARYNVEHKYPTSIQKQIHILNYCLGDSRG